MKNTISKCPICKGKMIISELSCDNCGTKISGKFELDPLFQLSSKQYSFMMVFLKCQGNIREIERKLGISYPTVKNRLAELLMALGFKAEIDAEKRSEIIDMLEEGSITAEEAIIRLRTDREK